MVAWERMDDALKIVRLSMAMVKKEWGKPQRYITSSSHLIHHYENKTSYCFYISGLGQFEMHLNGKKAGDHFLDRAGQINTKQALLYLF